jgi:hypothetical protein
MSIQEVFCYKNLTGIPVCVWTFAVLTVILSVIAHIFLKHNKVTLH